VRTSFLRPANPDQPPRIARDEIQVPPPKEIEEGEPASKLRTIGVPLIMIVAMGGMVALMLRSGRTFSPYMLMMPMILLMGMGTMMWGQGGGGGTSRAQLLSDRKAQTRGLGVTREKVFERGLSMHEGLQHAFPDPVMLPTLIGTDRMWEVTPTNDGFTALRYGLGDVELAARIVAPEAPPGEFLEPVGWVSTVRFLRHHSTVSSMPLAMATARFPIIGLSGEREVALGMLRAMLLHAAVTHGPDNLAMVVLTDNPDGPTWSWMKWLPHTQHPHKLDRLGSARMMYSDWSTLTDCVGGDDDDPDKVIDFHMNFDPHVEFTSDSYRHVLVVIDSAVTDKLVDSVIAPRAGVTWLMLNPPANALTADQGIVLRCDSDRTVWRTEADKPRAEPTKVAVADQVSLHDLRTVARQLAKYEVASLSSLGRQAKQAERGRDWATLMRVRDPGSIDPMDTWSAITRYGDKKRLRIPIGFLSTGDRLELDIKQSAEGGTGPHGQALGATGSGKSEFLRNLVLNACVTHSPSMLNLLLVDFKGGPTFLGMGDLPHVSAVITNMEEEAHLVERMGEMIMGEIERRTRILREADELSNRYDVKDIRDYEQLRERGENLPPLPSLFVIIDEFTELLEQHPEFGPLFKRVGRLGRSLGIELLFASQNLDISGRTSGLESNIGYKIGLKTQTAQESRALLDGSDAAYRLPGNPGHGVLRTSSGDRAGELVHFYAGFTGAAYFPPASEVVIERKERSADAGFIGPQAFTALEAPLPKDPSAVEVVNEPERTEEELENAPTIFTTVVEQLRSANHPPPYRMWLPPLSVKTLDQADPAMGHWAVPANTALPQLRVPIGLFDDAVKHAQPLWTIDTTDQNVLIIGGAQTGKSTAIKTLACSLALHNTPEQVQMYLVDYAGGGLGPLAGLPHVGGVATRAEPDAINRILSQVRTLITDRERIFREYKIGTMADYRRLRTDPNHPVLKRDSYGDVYMMFDGWDAAVAEGQVLQFRGSEVESLIVGALNYGVHLVLSTTRVVEMRGIEPHMKSILELHNETEMSRIGSALAKKRRREPGHVITSGSQLQGLVALPRIDGIDDRTTINSGMTDLVNQVAAQFATSTAERLRTLPTSLTYHQLADMVIEADRKAVQRVGEFDPRRRLRIALGVQEERLTPVYAEMYREPHLLIFGQSKSGKSEAVGAFYDSVTRRFATMDDAAVIFVDVRRRHLGKLDNKNLFAYVTNEDEFLEATYNLVQRYDLPSRDLPPGIDAETREARSWWTGPEVFVIIDDYHVFVNPRSYEEAAVHKALPWVANESLARGLHFVIGRASEELYLASNRDPLLRRLLTDATPTVMLSGNKMDGQIGEAKFENFGIPGRARYIETSFARKGRIQTAWSGIRLDVTDDFED
jgi:DNA segregation ATPase FtsK/SpoIIIE, S-DNA-T family